MATKAQHEMFREMSESIPRTEAELDEKGYVSWDEMQEKWWGPEGTPRRDRMERNMHRHLKADLLARKVTRHLGPIGEFWFCMLYERPGSLYGAMDGMANEYLGDFLFWGQPVTQDYYDSWVSKVHLPRLLHYHRGPERDCTHV